MTATTGRNAWTRSSWKLDSSATATSAPSTTSSSGGSKFPPSRARTPSATSSCSIRLDVPPLPAVPVTPTMGTSRKRYASSASPITSAPAARRRARSGWSMGTPGAATTVR